MRCFFTKIFVETPPRKKVCILWDNALSHKAKTVHQHCEELDVRTIFSKPYQPQNNGIAERAVRRVKEGTSCVLVQSGLSYEWWREAQECFCFLWCV